MKLDLDGSLVVEPAEADPVVRIAGEAYCSTHGEAKLAHSLFEALERALEGRYPKAV
jgi:hypothetical protein